MFGILPMIPECETEEDNDNSKTQDNGDITNDIDHNTATFEQRAVTANKCSTIQELHLINPSSTPHSSSPPPAPLSVANPQIEVTHTLSIADGQKRHVFVNQMSTSECEYALLGLLEEFKAVSKFRSKYIDNKQLNCLHKQSFGPLFSMHWNIHPGLLEDRSFTTNVSSSLTDVSYTYAHNFRVLTNSNGQPTIENNILERVHGNSSRKDRSVVVTKVPESTSNDPQIRYDHVIRRLREILRIVVFENDKLLASTFRSISVFRAGRLSHNSETPRLLKYPETSFEYSNCNSNVYDVLTNEVLSPFTINAVYNSLKRLKSFIAADPDQIPVIALKILTHLIAKPLYNIYQCSLCLLNRDSP
ncbi:hypothetical protein GJ496_008222 [Pomphorhynchus laevis]|nr:hypothetical protein GJ496_008222 [Pomphorhynchus laevis]